MPTTLSAGADLRGLERAREKLQLEWDEMAAIVGVDRTTLYRWRTGESKPRPIAWTRLTQLDELLEMLTRIFAGPDLARKWLKTSRPASLGGDATPLEVMKNGRIDRVLGLLQFLARGA
jgi:hypothetical protein